MQDTQLFDSRSIIDNVRYAQRKATDQGNSKPSLSYWGISKTGTDVYDACQAVQIHDQIKSFENGYDTVVGSRRCSGGETQRVSNRVGGDIRTEN